MSGTNLAVVPQDSAPAPAPASTPSPAPFYDDPDLRELEEARAAVAAEQAQGNQPAAPAAAPTVPLPRFNEVVGNLRKAEAEAAYQAGRAAALEAQINGGQPPQGNQPAAPAAPPPEHVEATAIEEGWRKAAEDFDNGAITASEMAQQQVPLLARLVKLHVGAGVQAMVAAIDDRLRRFQPQPGVVDQQVMTEQMNTLGKDHPWSTVMNEREASALVAMARAEATATGHDPYQPGAVGTMALRKRVAELASVHMPQWRAGQHPPAAPAPAAPAAPQPQPQAPAPTGTRPTTADIRTAMERQAAHPPSAPSSHSGSAGPVTLDRVDTMSDVELENMPPAERRRLLGVIQT